MKNLKNLIRELFPMFVMMAVVGWTYALPYWNRWQNLGPEFSTASIAVAVVLETLWRRSEEPSLRLFINLILEVLVDVGTFMFFALLGVELLNSFLSLFGTQVPGEFRLVTCAIAEFLASCSTLDPE